MRPSSLRLMWLVSRRALALAPELSPICSHYLASLGIPPVSEEFYLVLTGRYELNT